MDKIEWCIAQHKNTNHLYDGYLPYEYHLRMVVKVCQRFLQYYPNRWSEIELACWGHDLIEDTRVSYNDCKKVLGEFVTDIVYAVTNEKGKNRSERANEKYYHGIRNTAGASFVKLCDRIANVEYSIMTNSIMFDMYKKENKDFLNHLNVTATEELIPLSNHLTSLFS